MVLVESLTLSIYISLQKDNFFMNSFANSSEKNVGNKGNFCEILQTSTF